MNQRGETRNGARVTAPSRLHFGLFRLPPAGDARTEERYFGGIGLMVRKPGVVVTARPADQWSTAGPLSERAMQFAQRVSSQPLAVRVEQCAPEHVGLGTGTQLGLATATAAAVATGQEIDPPGLARRLGRGRRSALGLHGFAQGGFLVEGGKRSAEAISPLIVRADFPGHWAVLLIVPGAAVGLSGLDEQAAFTGLAARPLDGPLTDRLCRLVLLDLLPALADQDLDAFGESLFAFNRGVGEMFAPWQGGIYTHPRTAHLIDRLRGLGVRGVGQSSWGPAVFAIVAETEAQNLANWLIRHGDLASHEIILTQAAPQGGQISTAIEGVSRA